MLGVGGREYIGERDSELVVFKTNSFTFRAEWLTSQGGVI